MNPKYIQSILEVVDIETNVSKEEAKAFMKDYSENPNDQTLYDKHGFVYSRIMDVMNIFDAGMKYAWTLHEKEE
jgi:hypothetical protein